MLGVGTGEETLRDAIALGEEVLGGVKSNK